MSPLEAWALAALQSLPVYYEDVGNPEKPAQLAMIAKAITQAAKESKGWQGSKQQLIAIEIAIIKGETNASLRIHRNECKPTECDPRVTKGVRSFRAISIFQLHVQPLSSPEVFPLLGFMTFDSTLLAAKEASRVIIRSRGWCTGAHGDPIAMTISAYAGRGCKLDRWQGWQSRLATYDRVLRVPVPRDDSQKQAD
jgi:hypothetical protein